MVGGGPNGVKSLGVLGGIGRRHDDGFEGEQDAVSVGAEELEDDIFGRYVKGGGAGFSAGDVVEVELEGEVSG